MTETHRLLLHSSISVVIAALSFPVSATELTSPSFQRGLWRFERTTEHGGKSYPSEIRIEEMTRCVDPTLAMKATFRSPDVGNCRSAKAQLIDNRYVFSNRCDYLGPVRTEIIVESDTAYREVNELVLGNAPRKETIVARRLGDCQK